MGEARRRRAAEPRLGAPVPGGLHGGRPTTLLSGLLVEQRAIDRGERVEVRVPCGGCRACCHHAHIPIDPTRDDIRRLSVHVTDDGTMILDSRPDGACIHLTDAGCEVYAHRPEVCRTYDCRVYSLVGAVDEITPRIASPVWVFDTARRDDRILAIAAHACGMAARADARKHGIHPTAAQTWIWTLQNLRGTMDAVADMMSRDHSELGVNLRTAAIDECALAIVLAVQRR